MNKYKKRFKRLLIIDGSYLLFRSLHVPELYDMTNDEGFKVGGIYQFLRSFNMENRKQIGYAPICVFDGGISERRSKLYPDYKDRKVRSDSLKYKKVDPDEFLESYKLQRDVLIEMIKDFGIPTLHIKGFEGDDLIYILCQITEDAVILSDDKDFLQLVSDNVKVSRPLANEIVTLKSLSKQGYTPELYLIEKCLVGDRSDNIPNVTRGLGPKNAKRIASVIYDNPDDYLNILYESDKKVDIGFVENHSNYTLNRKLIDLSFNDDLDEENIEEILRHLNIDAVKKDYFKAAKWLGDYNISNIDIDTIMLSVDSFKKHILEG